MEVDEARNEERRRKEKRGINGCDFKDGFPLSFLQSYSFFPSLDLRIVVRMMMPSFFTCEHRNISKLDDKKEMKL